MINGLQCEKTCPGFVNNKGAEQPAHRLCYLFIGKFHIWVIYKKNAVISLINVYRLSKADL